MQGVYFVCKVLFCVQDFVFLVCENFVYMQGFVQGFGCDLVHNYIGLTN